MYFRCVPSSTSPVSNLTIYPPLPSCVALLHLSSATDALKDGKADSYHVRRLSDTSAAWTRMIYEAPHHFIYSVQCARPLSFPPLLLATINNLVATPAMLSSNQGCLQALSRHRDGGKAFDSRASLLHVVTTVPLVDLPSSYLCSQHLPRSRASALSSRPSLPWCLGETMIRSIARHLTSSSVSQSSAFRQG